MKSRIAMGSALFPLILAVAAFAANPDERPTFASVLEHQLTNVEKAVIPAADAMPGDKYDFAPTQGDFKSVRTFGAQVKHMAVATTHSGQVSSARRCQRTSPVRKARPTSKPKPTS